MDWDSALTMIHLVATWTMVGVIWFVQLVHYPMFRLQPSDGFVAFAQEHQRRTSWVVIPPMLIELATALLLLARSLTASFGGHTRLLIGLGLALLLVIWASTFLLQVPCHRHLLSGRDEPTLRRLVATNWVRTGGWTLRGVVALALLVQVGSG